MPPTRAQYFFASPWLLRIWMIALPFIVTLISAVELVRLNPAFPIDGFNSILFWFLLPVIFFLSFFSALLLGFPIIGSFLLARAEINGAPFHEGDIVEILTGPH